MKLLITPAQAQIWLEANTKNRSISPTSVNALVQQMKEGNWIYNGEAIIIGKSGRLLDGQHRLTAVVQSGVSITSEVITDIEDEEASFLTIDTGRGRSASDLMYNIKNRTAIAAAIKLLICIQDRLDNGIAIPTTITSHRKVPNREIVGKVEAVPFISEIVSSISSRDIKCLKSSSMICALYIARLDNERKYNEFIETMKSGMFTSIDCPAKALMSFVRNKKERGNTPQSDNLLMCNAVLKAFKLFKDGKKTKRLTGIKTDNIMMPSGVTLDIK